MLISLPDQRNPVILKRYFGTAPKSICSSKTATLNRGSKVECHDPLGLFLRPLRIAAHCGAPLSRHDDVNLPVSKSRKRRFILTRTQTGRQIRLVFTPAAPDSRGDRHQAVTWRQRPSVAVPPGVEHLQTSLPTASRDEAPAKLIASKNRDRRGRFGPCAVVTREGGGNVHRPT